ncbi:hypothetical protein Tco_0822912 [Tanacetum coccineum]|uniref:Reverse transcriptase Ty1/copia-type domain-containing protein n=1 Tax=Tanacetum coccineum TaxID=301880 RepID=A0ABQ5AKQ5_9ASTR
MVGSLMYLTASRPDLVFDVCMCARYQAKPTKKHLEAIKSIFRYLKGTINMGLWYPKEQYYVTNSLSRCRIMRDVRFDEEYVGRAQSLEIVDQNPLDSSQLKILRHILLNMITSVAGKQKAHAISCNKDQLLTIKAHRHRHHFIREQVENGSV